MASIHASTRASLVGYGPAKSIKKIGGAKRHGTKVCYCSIANGNSVPSSKITSPNIINEPIVTRLRLVDAISHSVIPCGKSSGTRCTGVIGYRSSVSGNSTVISTSVRTTRSPDIKPDRMSGRNNRCPGKSDAY